LSVPEVTSTARRTGRAELDEHVHGVESAEIDVLTGYLPAQLGAAELDAMIKDAIAATGAASLKDMGKVMGILKPKVQGRTDMGALSARIKSALGG